MRRTGFPVPAAPSSPPRRNRDPLPARPHVPSILVVGARVADRRHLAALLRRAGYDTREETDGAGALANALESPPDLVIVGTLATGMDAEEFTARMRTEVPLRRVPVLLHSSARHGTDGKRTDDGAGVSPVAAMGSDPQALLAVVQRLFVRRAPTVQAVPAVAPREPAATKVRMPTLPAAALPAPNGAIRNRDSSTNGFRTITLAPIDIAAASAAARLLAAADARIPDVAPVAARARGITARESATDGEGESDEPITFDPADILAFHRIVASRGAPGPAVLVSCPSGDRPHPGS